MNVFRTPEEWLLLGEVDNIRYPLPGQAFLPKGTDLTSKEKEDLLNHIYQWVNVAILDYDTINQTWNVLTLDGK